jgi:polysaccharide export outer membrane protein
MVRSVLRCGVLALALAAAACATGPSGPVLSPAEFQQRYPAAYGALGPGDRVRIGLYGDDQFTGEYQVGTDGRISLPLLGPIEATGRDVDQFARLLETSLTERGLYKSPRVSVQTVSVRPIYVLGEVNTPGAFPYVPDLTVGKAAALAGGYTYRARMSAIAVRRANAAEEVMVTADQAMPLAPGDTVRVLERHF